jgi:hypothetical protein
MGCKHGDVCYRKGLTVSLRIRAVQSKECHEHTHYRHCRIGHRRHHSVVLHPLTCAFNVRTARYDGTLD